MFHDNINSNILLVAMFVVSCGFYRFLIDCDNHSVIH